MHDDPNGLGEGLQRGFALDDAVAFRQMMLDIYGYRCAVTGAVHPSDAAEALDVFLVQPLAHGGTLTPANSIVVELTVARLIDENVVQIGDDFLVYLPQPLDLELGAALAGRPLLLPDNPSFWPSRSMLTYRRDLYKPH